MVAQIEGLDSTIAFNYIDSSIVVYQELDLHGLDFAYNVKSNLYFKYANYSKSLEWSKREQELNHNHFYSKSTLIANHYLLGNYQVALDLALDALEDNVDKNLNYAQYHDIFKYGYQAAIELDDLDAQAKLAIALVPLSDHISKEYENQNNFTNYIKKRNEEQHKQILGQKDQLIVLERDAKQRQKMISWISSLCLFIILVLSAAIFNLSLIHISEPTRPY